MREYEREVRTSPVEKSERQRGLRLVLILNEDTAQTELYGILPTLSWETLEDPSQVGAIIDGLTIAIKGGLAKVSETAFHPNRPEVLLRLDPSALSYEVRVESEVTDLNIAGIWRAEALSERELFVGEWYRGERVLAGASTSVGLGEFVFLVVEEAPDLGSVPHEKYKLGSRNVVAFELNEVTKSILSRYWDENVLDENAFRVDTVLPAWADPGTESPIEAPPLTHGIIAILPPKDLDPDYEVFQIPFKEEELKLIPRLGAGVPRFIAAAFPEIGSKRINIHWAGRHRVIHLHADEDDVGSPSPTAEQQFGVRIHDKDELLIPWQESSSHTLRVGIKTEVGRLIEVIGPPGMLVDLHGRFPEEGEVRGTVRAVDLSLEQVVTRLEDWIYEGCQEASVEFDSLGSVNLKFEATSRFWRNYDYEELLERVSKITPWPLKASWSFVRQVLDIPPGTRRSHIPGGMKKKVRKALREVRSRERSR